MNLIDEKRKLRTTFQALIIVAMVFYLINLQLPKSFNSKSISLLILTIISCVGLVAIAVRVNCKNVRRWEMILYYILNVVFVYIIVHNVLELAYIAEDIQIDSIPYADGTEEYYNAYDEADDIGLIAGFMFVLLGIPSIIMTIIFAIVGIIQTCIQKNEIASNETLFEVKSNQSLAKDVEIKQQNESNTPQYVQHEKANFCSHCGKPVDADAKFCKHCGKEIK